MLDDGVPFSDPVTHGPVEVVPRLWWVGTALGGDLFQNHAYLVEAGDDSVLVDPGSTLTIDATLEKVAAIIDPGRLRWIIVHHADPDVADGLHRLDEILDPDRTTVITEWRSEALVRHYACTLPVQTVEDLGWTLDLGPGRSLRFVLTPYLHFPGAFVTLETSTRTLLSADLFGGFNSARRLMALGPDDLEDVRRFHEHYMPSREILMTGLASIRAAMPDLRTICPQHGYVLTGPLVDTAFEQLSGLECGIFLHSRSDGHLVELLEAASVVRRIDDILRSGVAPALISEEVLGELRRIMPAKDVWFELLSDRDTNDAVFRLGGPSDLDCPTVPDSHHLVVPVTLDDGRPATAVVRLSAPTVLPPEITALLGTLAPAIRAEIAALLADSDAAERERQLSEMAYLDPLTGVPNRRALDDLVRPVAAAAVLMIDIDHFKAVNDVHGHPAGDEVLRRVARALVGALRSGERVFRYGGEEFMVIVEAAEVDALAAIGERLRATVEALDLTDVFGEPQRVTVSVGARLGRDREDTATVIRLADDALYRAKAAGRNRVEID